MKAIVWMTGAIASFCMMAVAARELSDVVSIFQMLFIRSIIGLAIVSVLIITLNKPSPFKSQRLDTHAVRNLFHFAGQYGWFLGIAVLPLAEVFALEFTVPIWTLLIAAVLLGESINRRKLLAIALGSVGVLIILQPGYAIVDVASLIVIAAAICYALSHTLTKSMTATDPAIHILFFMCFIQTPIALCLSLSSWLWPEPVHWFYLLVVALTALSAHYCIAQAMLSAEVGVVVTLDFLRLPLVALLGVWLYSEALEWSLLFGAALMLLANLIMQPRKKYSR